MQGSPMEGILSCALDAAGHAQCMMLEIPSSESLATLQGFWLVGGNQSHADRLYKRHPELLDHGAVLLPEAAMNKAFAAGILRSPASYPSTGFVGIQAALHCTEASVKLHIYGFNWSSKTWSGHNVSPLTFPPDGQAAYSCCLFIRRMGQNENLRRKGLASSGSHTFQRHSSVKSARQELYSVDPVDLTQQYKSSGQS